MDEITSGIIKHLIAFHAISFCLQDSHAQQAIPRIEFLIKLYQEEFPNDDGLTPDLRRENDLVPDVRKMLDLVERFGNVLRTARARSPDTISDDNIYDPLAERDPHHDPVRPHLVNPPVSTSPERFIGPVRDIGPPETLDDELQRTESLVGRTARVDEFVSQRIKEPVLPEHEQHPPPYRRKFPAPILPAAGLPPLRPASHGPQHDGVPAAWRPGYEAIGGTTPKRARLDHARKLPGEHERLQDRGTPHLLDLPPEIFDMIIRDTLDTLDPRVISISASLGRNPHYYFSSPSQPALLRVCREFRQYTLRHLTALFPTQRGEPVYANPEPVYVKPEPVYVNPECDILFFDWEHGDSCSLYRLIDEYPKLTFAHTIAITRPVMDETFFWDKFSRVIRIFVTKPDSEGRWCAQQGRTVAFHNDAAKFDDEERWRRHVVRRTGNNVLVQSVHVCNPLSVVYQLAKGELAWLEKEWPEVSSGWGWGIVRDASWEERWSGRVLENLLAASKKQDLPEECPNGVQQTPGETHAAFLARIRGVKTYYCLSGACVAGGSDGKAAISGG